MRRWRAPGVALTAHGVTQLAAGAALMAAGAVGGWEAPAVMGIALLAAAVAGLVEVLLARRRAAGARRAWLLPEPDQREERWARLDQHGNVIGSSSELPGSRGLYRQRSVRLTWHDAFGFWRCSRVMPAEREVCVAPAADARLGRLATARSAARALERDAEREPSGVRPYERGDGLRQVSWRQTAHHGELMSFERADAGAPSVLVVVDALGAADADALSATAAALLAALRDAPDVLVSDGVSCCRTPAQQARLLAALVSDGPDAGSAQDRASLVGRLALTAPRRRVLLVTCDEREGFGRLLTRGPLARSVTVVRARPSDAPVSAREQPPEGEVADKTQARGRRGEKRAEEAGRSPAHELLALCACVALVLLAMVPFVDVIYGDPWWQVVVGSLLTAGSLVGSVAGSLLRARRASGLTWALVVAALAAATLAAGVTCVLGELGAREQAAAGAPTTQVEGASALGRLEGVVADGVAQLGGEPWEEAGARWDLTIALAGAGLGAVAALLCGSRSLRWAVALLPVGVAVADQTIMGTQMPGWCAAVAALALLLAWLCAPRTRRVGRSIAVALLAAALGAGGAWATGPLGLGRFDSPVGTGSDTAVGTRVETLVDLSRDLTRNSSDVALTYTTTANRPLYLRLDVLNDLSGDTWEFSELGAPALDAEAPLEASAAFPLEFTRSLPVVTTNVRPASGGNGQSAVPPGTAQLEERDGQLVAVGRYFEPVTSPTDVSRVSAVLGNLQSIEASDAQATGPTELERAHPDALPTSVTEVASAALADGVGGSRLDSRGQIDVVGWLVSYFAEGGFTYSVAAPGGDGLDNLATIGEFLTEKRGYCTHYATSLALLARVLGVSSRVALGYLPSGATDESGAYVVTMRQLHAWCEVWVDGVGWVGVDVTPTAETGAQGETPLGDSVALEPDESPSDSPGPGVSDTLEAETPIVDEGADAPSDEQGTPDAPEATEAEGDSRGGDDTAAAEVLAWAAPVAACGALALAAALSALALGALRRRRLARGDWELAWRALCRTARRSGVRWETSATEDEIARLVCEALDDERLRAAVRRVERNACLARYAQEGAAPADASPELPGLLASVRRALK